MTLAAGVLPQFGVGDSCVNRSSGRIYGPFSDHQFYPADHRSEDTLLSQRRLLPICLRYSVWLVQNEGTPASPLSLYSLRKDILLDSRHCLPSTPASSKHI